MVQLISTKITLPQLEVLVQAVHVVFSTTPSYRVFEDFIYQEASECFGIELYMADIYKLYTTLF